MLRVGGLPKECGSVMTKVCRGSSSKTREVSNPSGMLGAWCAWGVVLSGYRQKGMWWLQSGIIRSMVKRRL